MITTDWLIQGLLIPFVIASGAVALAAVLRRRHAQSVLVGIAAAIGLAIACLLGDQATGGWPDVPPLDPAEWWRIIPNDWLTIVLLPAAAVCTLLTALPGRAGVVAWVGRAIVAVALLPMLMQAKLHYDWPTTMEAVRALDGPIVAVMVLWGGLALLARRQPSVAIPLSLALTAVASGVMLAMAGTLVVGQMSLSLAAGLAGIGVVGVAWPGRHGAVGAVDVGVVGLVGVLAMGATGAQLTLPHALLLGATPLALWVGMLPIVRDWRPWQRIIAQLLLVAILLAAIVTPEALAYEAPM